MKSIREILEEKERKILSPYATLSSQSRGRLHPEAEDPTRPAFQHDRDRIIHSKSFRRLKHKTQVFLSPAGDHYRTRLTHTLEVSQIARTISKALGLNEDLTEAIALGHDLGHTPFGHAGESVLNDIMPGGFRHYEQSLRVVDILERDGKGLNLTFEVRDGILKHSKGLGDIIPSNKDQVPATLEGQAVRIADVVAYINHDLDDALRSGIIGMKDVPEEILRGLGDTHSSRINTLVVDIIQTCLAQDPLTTIQFSPPVERLALSLRAFLYEKVYKSPQVISDFRKSSKILKELFAYFAEDKSRLSGERRACPADEPYERCVCDFIAGMTDQYALQLYQEIFLPHPWMVY
ncbi:MAG: deoxyguanosinetriphosphate triphosphohydrolase [Deltaproteobacteria bacterium]|nr:MAG: deoxyguanosinetriphosphate triphosphohydrolase [Deltaproteobacteria bacterium]